MKKITNDQVEVLGKFAVNIYETFILADQGLMDSTCGCCKEKRKLQKKLLKEFEKMRKGRKKA